MRLAIYLLLAMTFGAVTAHYHQSGNNTYTLYRNSPLDPHARLHVGTFNTKEPDPNYNRTMCEFVQGFLQRNPETQARWWCEAGTVHDNNT
jgi:hypothetical protein